MNASSATPPVRLLVIGRRGQLAQSLVRQAGRAGIECTAGGRERFDLSDTRNLAHRIAETVLETGATAVVNAAAYTAVDLAESNEAEAFRINAEAVGELAAGADDAAVPLIHVSTDYVFDGSAGSPYRPADRTSPLGAYGRSKLAGEWAARANTSRHAVVRTAWVYGIDGSNFMMTMLRLAAQRDVIRVVDDQWGSPTEADELAQALLSIAARLADDPALSGTYHYCGTGQTSWAGFARAIFEEARTRFPYKRWPDVEPISTEQYPTPARRPLYSVLDTKLTRDSFGIPIAPWRERLTNAMDRLDWKDFA